MEGRGSSDRKESAMRKLRGKKRGVEKRQENTGMGEQLDPGRGCVGEKIQNK